MAKLLPVLFVVLGLALGGGAGYFLQPSVAEGGEDHSESDGDADGHDDGQGGAKDDGHGDEASGEAEFVKLNNQFVVPVLRDGRVAALVILSLSLEVTSGGREQIYSQEPKIRDALLSVLLDHANLGGFDGQFTSSRNMSILRQALTETAQQIMSADAVASVLVTDIVRQEMS